jgi:hypothetical protein
MYVIYLVEGLTYHIMIWRNSEIRWPRATDCAWLIPGTEAIDGE